MVRAKIKEAQAVTQLNGALKELGIDGRFRNHGN
ncbi:MAG: hypothetical protein BWX48_01528 [Verrucomicrobia bacterium ADurb.Bin006]|jgi:hypothetical protein|nr:MAG: hypothetical protein BWX48_01528 [Verrucomicrobia bacterium ADurb.Bin006]